MNIPFNVSIILSYKLNSTIADETDIVIFIMFGKLLQATQQLIGLPTLNLAMDTNCDKFSLLVVIRNILNGTHMFQIISYSQSFSNSMYNFKVINIFSESKSQVDNLSKSSSSESS